MKRRTLLQARVASAGADAGMAGAGRRRWPMPRPWSTNTPPRSTTGTARPAGPKAQAGKTIVVLAGDMKNGGILGVTNGVEEAAAAIGWEVKVLDGAGSIGGRTAAFGQAMALKPDGIIINGFDAVEQRPALEQAKAAGIPLVAWHAGPAIGPDRDDRPLRQCHAPMPWKSPRPRPTGPMSMPRASRA